MAGDGNRHRDLSLVRIAIRTRIALRALRSRDRRAGRSNHPLESKLKRREDFGGAEAFHLTLVTATAGRAGIVITDLSPAGKRAPAG